MLNPDTSCSKSLKANSVSGVNELRQDGAAGPCVQTHPRPSVQLPELPQLPGDLKRGVLPVPWWRPLVQIHVNRVQRARVAFKSRFCTTICTIYFELKHEKRASLVKKTPRFFRLVSEEYFFRYYFILYWFLLNKIWPLENILNISMYKFK